MDIHYNAFISYRHHPDDIRVASEIHKSLERFKVPRSIRKKYGKITQLFRDKEELPITSDLNDDIDAALKNSDYLIVICSVHLKESIWCQREIERFLQTHPKNRVLTVLASGEPYDVIPEILLYDDVVDPVTGKTERIPIEPLSCDWRSKRRKIRQEELPRLAAPLLGCAYNELRQRQKQYRARRNMAIVSTSLAASLCLTAYFLHTSITIQKANVQIQAQNEEIQAQNEEIKAANIQIQANLDESLINQSMHLATAAEERLADGDRLTAISLAAAALPSDQNVRPYVPEAERVLTEALGVYNTATTMEAVGAVTPGVNVLVNSFCVTDSERVLYLYDQQKVITCWDTQTLQKLGQIQLGEAWLDTMLTLKNDNLVILNADGVFCYRPDGTLAWQWKDCFGVTYRKEANLPVLMMRAADGSCSLLPVDPDTGKQAEAAYGIDVPEEGYEPVAFVADANDASDMVAVSYAKPYGSIDLFYAVDMKTGMMQKLPLAVFPTKAMVTRDEKLVVMGQEEGVGMAAVVEGNRVTMPGTKRILCYDLRTGRQLWENAITAPVGAITSGIREIPGSDDLLMFCGNIFMTVDSQTGATVASCGAGSVIVNVSAGEASATAVLQDGFLCYYHYDSNDCYEVKCMENGVDEAAVGEGLYCLHWQEDHVTLYQNITGEPAWESAVEGGFSVKKQKVWGSYLAFQDYSRQYLFDLNSQTFLWTMEKGRKELLGFSSDGKKLWYAEGTKEITAADIATGSCETIALELKEGESVSVNRELAFWDDCLYYTVKCDGVHRLVCQNLNTGEKVDCTLALDPETDLSYWDILLTQGQYAWLLGNGKTVLEVDMQTGKTQQVIKDAAQRPAIAVRPDGTAVAVSSGGNIYLKKPGQGSLSVIKLDNANAGSMIFREDFLLVMCDNGFIDRFDMTGKRLSQTELWVGSQFSYEMSSSYADLSKLSWQFTDDNMLVVSAMGDGNVIDCGTWTTKATLSNFLLYDASSNSLVCKHGSAIAGYTLHNTKELLQLAKETLGTFRLTQEQKISYGID